MPLALLGSAFYSVLVHELADYDPRFLPHARSPFTQLRFTSFAVINLRRDFHPQECAPCWAHMKKPPEKGA